VGASPKMHSLPRPFLRWYCGEQVVGGYLGNPGTKGAKRQEPLAQVSRQSASRIGIRNIEMEDIDCHFENILVMFGDTDEERSVIDRLLNTDEAVDDVEIDVFVDTFFARGHNRILLQAVFFSEETVVSGERKRVTFVKCDNESDHPEGYPSIRFQHFFEALPSCKQPFSKEVVALLQDRE
jgi:hypothetical protein